MVKSVMTKSAKIKGSDSNTEVVAEARAAKLVVFEINASKADFAREGWGWRIDDEERLFCRGRGDVLLGMIALVVPKTAGVSEAGVAKDDAVPLGVVVSEPMTDGWRRGV